MRARTRSFPSRLATRSTRRRAPATAIQAPCEEIDQIDRLDSGTTFTKRAFYDGEGRLVETRASGFNSQDVVIFAYYDTAGRQIFKSNTYFVAAYTGAPGAAAYSIPDSTQPGTTTNYALNAGITTLRTTSVTNPNSFTTKTIVSVVCNVSGTSDMGCYVQKMVVDANGHGRATLTGGLGKANYTQTYTGVGGSYTLYTTTTMTYDSAGNLLSTKSPDGSTTTTLASNLAYSGLAGAAGQITTMDYGSGDIYTASYDTGLRLTSVALTRASDNTLLYQTQPAYDAANNVVSVQTSITGATDTQQFCYDALNRLTWAGASGTPPCATLTPGTLTAAQYQQSDSYNLDSGLTSGPNGSSTYGDSHHPHAVTATSTGYSAAYDAAGNMTCRSLTSATTCSGTPTGQQLSSDNEGRLATWESQPNAPAQTASYLYDGAGTRVAMQTTVNGTTTLTAYIGSIEEVQTTGSVTTTTTYYTVQGKRIAANVNGSLYYFGYDALGSQVAVLNASGNLVGSQLYGPYGNSRYSNGTLPTSIGFTGQRSDSVTGLDYYVARYYDPVVDQFLTADTVQGNAQGMDPYAYVGGNPETMNDPTGYCPWCITLFAGAIIGAVAAATSDVISGKPITWQSVVGGAVGGALLAGGGVLLAGVGLASVTGAGVWDVVSSSATIGNATWWSAGIGGVIGGIWSGLSGIPGNIINHFFPGPDDPQSYQDGQHAQATADAQGSFATQTAAVNNYLSSTAVLAAAQENDPARKAMEARQAKEHAAFIMKLRARQRNIGYFQRRYGSNWGSSYNYAAFGVAIAAGAADNGSLVRMGSMNIS